MAAITIPDLNNAKRDVDHIATLATSSASTATDRLGNTKLTVKGAMNSLAGTNPRGAWSATPTPSTYTLNDLVVVSSVVYKCIIAHAPSGSFATDLAAGKWAVHKGVTAEDLALPTATQGIGHAFPQAPAFNKLLSDIANGLPVSIDSFLDQEEVDEARARTLGVDHTDRFIDAAGALYDGGGGALLLPAGSFLVGSWAFEWAAVKSIDVRGSGIDASRIHQMSGASGPVIDWFSAELGDGNYSALRDLTVVGNGKAQHGVRCTLFARSETHSLGITGCDVGFEGVGALVMSHFNPAWVANNIGYRSRKSGTIYCNEVNIFGGAINLNTAFAADIGDTNGTFITGTDVEKNGTIGDIATGGIKIQSTVSAETGYANVTLRSMHLEAQRGKALVCGDASGLNLKLDDVSIYNSEDGRAIEIGAINCATLNNVVAPGGSDVVTIAATSSILAGGTLATIADTSLNQDYTNVATGAGVIVRRIKRNGVSAISVDTANQLNIGAAGIVTDYTGPTKIKSAGFVSGRIIVGFSDTGGGSTHSFHQTNGTVPNAADAGLKVSANASTSRSINAGGTINAAGADYAEYEWRSAGCRIFAKGDLVGFDADGKLTHEYVKAVRFGIKSTNPCMVGGDVWFNEQPPLDPTRNDGETDEAFTARFDAWEQGSERAAFKERMEAARQTVDRIAYAGKVPCNVEASVGDFIVPAEGPDGAIVGVAIPEEAITFVQYRKAVGQVQAVVDGRPIVVVKTC